MTQPDAMQIKVDWSSRFPLKKAFLEKIDRSGLYLWGFDSTSGEVIWYVAKQRRVFMLA
jgi:hypothetical protein